MEIEVGSELTSKYEIFDIGGKVILDEGQKVIVREVEYTGGYWSRLCPDIYIPVTPQMVKLVGIYGSWKLSSFIETNH